jgi:hypothetical protein
VEPLVLRLDVAGLPCLARAGPGTNRSRPAGASCPPRRVAPGGRGEVLPAVEVGVRLQVGLPGVLDGGLERHHEDASRRAASRVGMAKVLPKRIFAFHRNRVAPRATASACRSWCEPRSECDLHVVQVIHSRSLRRDERVDLPRCVLRRLVQQDKEPGESACQVGQGVLGRHLRVKWTDREVGFRADRLWLTQKRSADDLVRVGVPVSRSGSRTTDKDLPSIHITETRLHRSSIDVTHAAVLVHLQITMRRVRLALERRLEAERLSGADQLIESSRWRQDV